LHRHALAAVRLAGIADPVAGDQGDLLASSATGRGGRDTPGRRRVAGWSGRRAGRLAGQQQPDGQQHGEDGAWARGQTHAALLVSPLTRRGEGTLRTRPGQSQSSRRQVRAVVVNPPPAGRSPGRWRPAQWTRVMACWRTVNRLPAAR
jgi:hypothetical protein